MLPLLIPLCKKKNLFKDATLNTTLDQMKKQQNIKQAVRNAQPPLRDAGCVYFLQGHSEFALWLHAPGHVHIYCIMLRSRAQTPLSS